MMHKSFPPDEGAFGALKATGYTPTTELLGLEERFFKEHSPRIALRQYEIEAGRLRSSIKTKCAELRWPPDKLEKLLIEFEWFFADYVKHNNLRLSELFNGDYGHLVITPKIGKPIVSGLYYPCLLIALFSTDPDEIGHFLEFQQELFNANANNHWPFLDFLNLHLNRANHELKELVEGIGLQTAREWIREQEKSGKTLSPLGIQSYDLNQADWIYVTEENERLLVFDEDQNENSNLTTSDRGHNSTHEQKPANAHVPDREYLVALRQYFMLLNKPNPLQNNGPYMDKGLIRIIFKEITNSELDSETANTEELGYTIEKKEFASFLYQGRLFWPGKPQKAMTLNKLAKICLKYIDEWKSRTSEKSMANAFLEYRSYDLAPQIDWRKYPYLKDFMEKHHS